MSLYENMQALDQLSLRLHAKQYTDDDISNLAWCLKEICDGKDAHKVLGINAGKKGMRRSDYRKHRKISEAFQVVAAYIDPCTVGTNKNGEIIVFDSAKKEIPMLKKAIIDAATLFNMKPATLATYWKDKQYAHLKTPLI